VIAENQLAALMRVRQAFPDRLILVSGLLNPDFSKACEAAGMPAAREPTHNLRAIAALHQFGVTLAQPYDPPKVAPATDRLPSGSLNEIDAMAVLQRIGVPVNRSRLARTADEAATAAAELGFPVVLKVVSGDVLHKTDVGGVKLGLADAAAVRAAFDEIMRVVPAHMPKAKIDGCLVAPMVTGGSIETILGVTSDPMFGPIVMFGLGGVLVEALGDVSFRVAPFDEDEAHRMIREIRTFKVLEGLRGAPRCDIDAIARALSALSRFAAAHRDQIVSMEANPFLVRPEGEGAVALDAVVVSK
jgi:acyl-CoA synthetase (NDP forming)